MRLTDLDPRWLVLDGKRVGFVFKCPTDQAWWQTCFVEPLRLFTCDACKGIGEWHCPHSQSGVVEAAGVDPEKMQGCTYGRNWQIAGAIEGAEFATMTVTPSLDGSKGGLWHGFITRGEIVGGI